MNANDISVFQNILNEEIVDILHKKLIDSPRWLVATNRVSIDFFQKGHDATDSGLILCSYENQERDYKFSPDSNDDPIFRELNFFADLILDLVLNRCRDNLGFDNLPVFKNVKVIRYFWNYYHNNSKGTVHIDSDEENHWSIVFYINQCPEGGTVICNNDDQEITIPHVSGDAVIFPSSRKHYGLSPEKNHHRVCLNILFKADRIKNIVHIGNQIVAEDNK
jgi:hypothetical protein